MKLLQTRLIVLVALLVWLTAQAAASSYKGVTTEVVEGDNPIRWLSNEAMLQSIKESPYVYVVLIYNDDRHGHSVHRMWRNATMRMKDDAYFVELNAEGNQFEQSYVRRYVECQTPALMIYDERTSLRVVRPRLLMTEFTNVEAIYEKIANQITSLEIVTEKGHQHYGKKLRRGATATPIAQGAVPSTPPSGVKQEDAAPQDGAFDQSDASAEEGSTLSETPPTDEL